MCDSLRISIADDEPRVRDFLWKSLERMGHVVASGARTGRELVSQCREHQPDLVISDVKMPDMDGIEASDEIYQTCPVPIILLSAFHSDEMVRDASRHHILAYLVKPITESDLGPAIAIAMERFLEFESLRVEAADLRQALENRKTIERAKGIVMMRTGLNEADAFRRLQKLASARSEKLIEIARMIVTAEAVVKTDES